MRPANQSARLVSSSATFAASARPQPLEQPRPASAAPAPTRGDGHDPRRGSEWRAPPVGRRWSGTSRRLESRRASNMQQRAAPAPATARDTRGAHVNDSRAEASKRRRRHNNHLLHSAAVRGSLAAAAAEFAAAGAPDSAGRRRAVPMTNGDTTSDNWRWLSRSFAHSCRFVSFRSLRPFVCSLDGWLAGRPARCVDKSNSLCK